MGYWWFASGFSVLWFLKDCIKRKHFIQGVLHMFPSLILKVRKAKQSHFWHKPESLCNSRAHFRILTLTEPLSGQFGTHSQVLSLLSWQKNALKIICKELTFLPLLCFLFSQKAQLHRFWTQREMGTTRKRFQSKTRNYLLFVHSFPVPSESSNLVHASGMPTDRTRFTSLCILKCICIFHKTTWRTIPLQGL